MEERYRYYYPDIYIPEYNLIVEIKPEDFIDNQNCIDKMNESIRQGYKYIFITEIDKRNNKVLEKISRFANK